jgi:hypothetical protein
VSGRGHGEKMTKRAHLAIAALMAGRSNVQAAADAGVGHTTLERWLKLPSFQRLYAEARRRAVEAAVARMSCLALGAVETLARHLNAGAPLVEIKSAVALLGNLKSLGGLDVEERLAKLEERIEAYRAGKTSADGRASS